MATRVRFEGKRATGVDYLRGRPQAQHVVNAGEVMLCGGAINTPQLLQLSGIGDPDHLRPLGRRRGPRPARRRREPPGPPRGLHPARLASSPSPSSQGLKWRNRPLDRLEWLFKRTRPGASNHFEGGGFARSNDDVDWPNLMFHFLPIAIRYDGSPPAGQDRYAHGYQVHIGPMYADTRGWVRIDSTDPRRNRRCCSTT